MLNGTDAHIRRVFEKGYSIGLGLGESLYYFVSDGVRHFPIGTS